MSTKAAATYEDSEKHSYADCILCGVHFVNDKWPGDVQDYPENICIWCYTRNNGRLFERYMKMYAALKSIALNHNSDCPMNCFGHQMFETVKKVIEK